MTGNNIDNPHFVASHDFHGDAEYVAWLQEIKARYQRIRSRVALQANYGALEFNWQLGRDLVEKKAEQKWGAGVVEQLSLDLRAAYPDVKGFSSRNLWYMKQWYLFYSGNSVQTEKLHRLGAELQSIENQNPVKLHQLGAEMVSPNRIASIIDNGEMLPVFGIVPWKHHILIASKSSSIEEAFYYLQRTIDEGLSRSELEDLFADGSLAAEGHIPLQREVDALAQDDGGIVGQGKGQTAVGQGIADDRQGQRNAHDRHLDAGPYPFDVSDYAVEKSGQESQQQILDEGDHITEQDKESAFPDPLGRLGMLFGKIIYKILHVVIPP